MLDAKDGEVRLARSLPMFEEKKEAVRVRAAAGYLRLESIKSARTELARNQEPKK